MSPDLERLLEALYERDHCEPDQRAACDRVFGALLEEVILRLPDLTQDQLLIALMDRYQQFKKARKKYSSMPPQA